jgi:putative tryptophan/tyrosine transport system substrate-binding protein
VVDRRAFVLGGVLALAPAFAEAQESRRRYRIGMLSPETPPPGLVEGLKERLSELGYVEGKTYVLEARSGGGNDERLGALADELVRARVDVIVAVNTPAAFAARKATTKIPIVITRVADPVRSGLVSSLSQPGGNITGISFLPDAVAGKRLQLLKEAIPGISHVAALWLGTNTGAELSVVAMEASATQLGVKVTRRPVMTADDLAGTLERAARDRAGAVVVIDDAFITQHRRLLVGLAAKHSLPVASLFPPVAEAGGFIAYGPDATVLYRRAGDYVERLLKGADPASLPIEQPTKFHLAINLKTAKILGLTIPPSLLLRVDQLIE